MHGLQHHVFARHVVRFRRHRAQRTAPQHILARRRAQQIRQIRMAARELLDGQTLAAFNLAAQIVGQSLMVQFLACADASGIDHPRLVSRRKFGVRGGRSSGRCHGLAGQAHRLRNRGSIRPGVGRREVGSGLRVVQDGLATPHRSPRILAAIG